MPERKTRHIAHLDLDCFFVSVERIKNPDLNGKPVIVGGSPGGRGVVASASYEARAFGVRSAMPTGQALKLCPALIVVRGSHDEYGEISHRLYRRMLELAPVVERASIDEMYLDLTGCETLYRNDLPGFIRSLQVLVKMEFSLPCTIALATNKTVAKIAAGTVKPNGIGIVPAGTEREFLAPLPVDVIPGVGEKTAHILNRNGIRLVSDLQKLTKEDTVTLLGAHGDWLHRVANGRGNDVVVPEYERKSIGHEQTFATDSADRESLQRILFSEVEEVCSSLRARGWKTKTVTLKLRYSDFTTITRSKTIPPTHDDAVVFQTVKDLFLAAYSGTLPVRLLGVQLSNFDRDEPNLSLFPESSRRDQLFTAVDALRKKHGDDVIHVGGA